MTGRPRARSATSPSPRSAGRRTAAPPAARPRSAAATNNSARPSPSRPPDPAGEITVYECPDRGDRYLGEQRCQGCGTFARRVGIGGPCPNCDGPVAISDLLDQAVVTITNK